jgi:hypothetical protein
VKKLTALFVAFAFAAGIAGLASAQTQSAPKMEKPAAEKKAETKKMAMKSASGTVKSSSADSVVVGGKEKGKEAEWTFAVDPKTKIKKGGKDITAADLKAGDQVSVRYMEHEGKAVAQAINVKAAPMAKKSEAKPAAEKK